MFEQDYTENNNNENFLIKQISSNDNIQENHSNINPNIEIDGSNIFENELNCLFDKNPEDTIHQIRRRINDFDSSLILENATKTINNKSLKIELKITSTEKELDKINDQINLLELLNLDYDRERLKELYRTKDIIEDQIYQLKEEYKKMGFIYYLSNIISDTFNKLKIFFSKKSHSKLTNKILKIFPFLQKNSELNGEIKKLKLIQQKLWEKSNTKTPYGEKDSETNYFIEFLGIAKRVDAKINKMVDQKQS